jgi:hypothetical protein
VDQNESPDHSPDEIAILRQDLQSLKQEQARLEARLNQLYPPAQTEDPLQGLFIQHPESYAFQLSSKKRIPQQLTFKPHQMQRLEDWIGLRGFSWLGIFALVMGFGLFVRYAYIEGWLGPWAVLFTGLLLSIAMLGLGEWLARNQHYRTWAHALMGGGIALLYFLVYAGYHFSYFRKVTQLNQLSDAILMMAVVGLAIFLALRRNSQSLASRAFILGFVTSLLSQQLETLTLFYNLFLSLGLAWVAGRSRWPYLGLVGAMGSFVLHYFWVQANPNQIQLAFATLLILSLLFSLLGEYLEDSAETAFWSSGIPIQTISLVGFASICGAIGSKLELVWYLAGIGFWLSLQLGLQFRRLFTSESPVSIRLQKLYAWPWGVAIVLFDFALTNSIHTFGLALLLTVLGLASLFWGHWVSQRAPQLSEYVWIWSLSAVSRATDHWLDPPFKVAIWSVLATATWFKSGNLPWLRAAALALTASATGFAIAQDFQNLYSQPGYLTLFSHLVLVLLAQIQVWLAIEKGLIQIQLGLSCLAALVMMAWLQACLDGGWVSVAWVLAGCLLLGLGFALKQKNWRFQGIGILGLSSLRVFLYDLQTLGLGFKILSLVGLGVGLLGMALVYTRFQANKTTDSETSATQS